MNVMLTSTLNPQNIQLYAYIFFQIFKNLRTYSIQFKYVWYWVFQIRALASETGMTEWIFCTTVIDTCMSQLSEILWYKENDFSELEWKKITYMGIKCWKQIEQKYVQAVMGHIQRTFRSGLDRKSPTVSN